MIRHAIFAEALRHLMSILPLPVLVIETAFGALLMAAVDPTQADSTCRRRARRRAVDVPAVATPTEHETLIAARALAVPQRIVHVVLGVDVITLDTDPSLWQGSAWVGRWNGWNPSRQPCVKRGGSDSVSGPPSIPTPQPLYLLRLP